MRLKFIGEDGSLGLEHGKVYNVSLKTYGKFLLAIIDVGWFYSVRCPYGSMKAFAKNWELENYGR